MLRNFLYLNESALDSYVGAVEGGLSDESTSWRRRGGGRHGDLRIGAGGLGAAAGGSRAAEEEEERTVRDTPEQRFDRLIETLEADPEEYSYEEVLDLADAFDRLPVGYFITIDCELYVPADVLLFSQPEQFDELAGMLEAIRPLGELLGEDLAGLPGKEEVDALRGAVRAIKSDLVVVGEQVSGGPKVAGRLEKAYVRYMPEGEGRVVGKVARRWKEGESHSLIALPGASLMTRQQRRKSNTRSDEGNALEGPALTLDILAIYR